MLGRSDRDIAADAALSQSFEVGFAAIPGVGRSLLRLAAQIGLDAVEQRHQLVLVTHLCDQVVRDDDLGLAVDGGLGVIALDEAVLGLQDAALGIGEVALRFGRRFFLGRCGWLAALLAA